MSAFLAIPSTTQSITSSIVNPINFGTEVFDLDSVFASNVFVVPAGWGDKMGELCAGVVTGALFGATLHIQRSQDGGSTWNTILRHDQRASGARSSSICARTGPLIFVAGDRFRVAYEPSAGATVQNTPSTFFGGLVHPLAPSARGFARLRKTAAQSVGASTTVEVAFDLAEFETAAFFSSGRIVIPAGTPPSYGIVTAGVEGDATNWRSLITIQQSKDGGSTWGFSAETGSTNEGRRAAVLGPVLVEAGDVFRAQVRNNSGAARDILAAAGSFLALEIFTLD